MTGMSDLFCLICDITVNDSSSVNICTSSQRDGEPLVNFATRIFRPTTLEFRSTYICLQCYKLFQMLEQAQCTVANIRCEILKVYGRSRKERAIKQELQGKGHDFVENFGEQNEAVTDGMVHQIKATLPFRSIGNEIITSQTFSQDAIFNQDMNIQSIDTIIENNTTKVIKNTSTKIEEVNCLSKEDISQTNIKDSTLPQNDQTQKQNFLHAYKTCVNIVETKTDEENSFRKEVDYCDIGREVDYCGIANVNTSTEVYCAPASENSKRVLKHNSESMEHLCSTCGTKWKTRAELRAHMKTHLTLRIFMCEKCGRVYKHKHALEVHVGMHNGINPFQCSYCKKCFTQKGALIRHLPIHTGETPYQCEMCGKRFIHHTSYNMHMSSHNGKKPHKCEICDKFLLSTSHLKRHMRVHTGERPYSCYICGKRFAERYNLLVHHKIHDPDGSKMRQEKKVQKKCEQNDLVSSERQKLDIHPKCQDNSGIFNIDVNAAEISDSFVSHVQTQDTNMKQTNYRDNANEETWMQPDNVKMYGVDDQTRLVFSLPHLVTNPLVTFTEQDFSVQSINCDTNLQVDVASNAVNLNGNHIVSTRI